MLCGFLRLGVRLIALAVLVFPAGVAVGQKANARQLEFFEKKTRPVLVKHCLECHSADADDVGGGVLLDSREGAGQGGETGPAVVPGKVRDSLIIAERLGVFRYRRTRKLS